MKSGNADLCLQATVFGWAVVTEIKKHSCTGSNASFEATQTQRSHSERPNSVLVAKQSGASFSRVWKLAIRSAERDCLIFKWNKPMKAVTPEKYLAKKTV